MGGCLQCLGREAPKIEIYPSGRRHILSVGNSLFLECRVEGIPTPAVRWTKSDGTGFPSHLILSRNNTILRLIFPFYDLNTFPKFMFLYLLCIYSFPLSEINIINLQ